MGGAGGSCFDHRPPRPHFHGNNLTYYLLSYYLLIILPTTPKSNHAWRPGPVHILGVNRGNLVRERGRYESGPERAAARRQLAKVFPTIGDNVRGTRGGRSRSLCFASSQIASQYAGWHFGGGLDFQFFVSLIDGN